MKYYQPLRRIEGRESGEERQRTWFSLHC